MRCFALAQAWNDLGGETCFAFAEMPQWMQQVFRAEGISVFKIDADRGSIEDARATSRCADDIGACALVLDGYSFGIGFQSAVRESRCPTLFLDDYCQVGQYDTDLLLDQNIGVTSSDYQDLATGSRLLPGTRYILLQRKYLKLDHHEKTIEAEANRVLITLGFGDPANSTSLVIRALDRLEAQSVSAVVVVSSDSMYYDTLKEEIRRVDQDIQLMCNVTDMPDLMDWADIAISAGGTTCWELAFMGVPGLLLIQTENQRLNAERLDSAGVFQNLGTPSDCDEEKVSTALSGLLSSIERREEMSRKGSELVDGNGAARVIRELEKFIECD